MATGRRRHDIDWLRTLASYLVIAYHAAQFFDFQRKTYFKNAELSRSMDIFTQFVHLWHMPLFFLVAGWSSKLSMSNRGALRFLTERGQKLFVPLLFGLFVLCAPPRWVELKNGLWKTTSGKETLGSSQSTISFTTFVQEYYYHEGGVSWNHLWFLAYLFTFSVIYFPGFWVLGRMESISRSNLQRWGWVLANAPVIPLTVIQVTLRDRWPGYQNLVDDWANFFFFSIFFVTGFCLAQFPAFEDYIHSRCGFNAALGTISSVLYLLPSLLLESFQLPTVAQRILSALAAWYIVCSLLSFARQALSDKAPPRFWAESAFPVYVIHDVPLSLIADVLLSRWKAPIAVKFVFSAASALISSLMVLHLIVNRVALFRFLVGLKTADHQSSAKKLS